MDKTMTDGLWALPDDGAGDPFDSWPWGEGDDPWSPAELAPAPPPPPARRPTRKARGAQLRMVDGHPVEVRASAKRTRTVAARWEGATLVVMTPLRLSAVETDAWVVRMLEQALAAKSRRTPSDEKLMARAVELNRTYFGGAAVPTSVRWSTRQHHRWGSCTHLEGTIRLSSALKGMPAWVVDSVLVHELAHLLQADHGPEFKKLVARYPGTQRADAFLLGVQHGARLRAEGAEVPDGSC